MNVGRKRRLQFAAFIAAQPLHLIAMGFLHRPLIRFRGELLLIVKKPQRVFVIQQVSASRIA